MERQTGVTGSKASAKSKGAPEPKVTFTDQEGRGKNGFAQGGDSEGGLAPFGKTNVADEVRKGLTSAGHTSDRTKARGRGAASRG